MPALEPFSSDAARRQDFRFLLDALIPNERQRRELYLGGDFRVAHFGRDLPHPQQQKQENGQKKIKKERKRRKEGIDCGYPPPPLKKQNANRNQPQIMFVHPRDDSPVFRRPSKTQIKQLTSNSRLPGSN